MIPGLSGTQTPNRFPGTPGFQSGAPCLSFGNHRQKEALYWPYPACSTGTHRLCCFPGHSLRSLMCPHLLLPQNRLPRKDFRFRLGSGRCRCPVSRRDSVCGRYPVSRPGSVCHRCPVSRPGSVCRRCPVSLPVPACRRCPWSRPVPACRRCPVSRPGSVCRRYPVSRPGPESCPEIVSQQDCWLGRTRLFPKTMRPPETGLLLFSLFHF